MRTGGSPNDSIFSPFAGAGRRDGVHHPHAQAAQDRLNLRGNRAQNVDLEVIYRRADGGVIGSNAGTYRTSDDALAALAAFTEPGLLTYIEETHNG